jgi:glycosyltransferase involved in cell wall biosynthesis
VIETAAQQIEAGPVRVLFVSHSAKLYGAERSLLLLVSRLDRGMFEPVVVLPEDGPLGRELTRQGIETEIVRLPWWVRSVGPGGRLAALLALPVVKLREFSATWGLCGLIRRRKIDLVYTNTLVILGGALAARLTGRPHLWHVREILENNPDLVPLVPRFVLHRLILGLSAGVIANSGATAAPLQPADRHGRLQVVHNAVTPLAGDRPATEPRDIAGIGPSDWVAAWIGALQSRKRPEDAILAAAEARRQIHNLKLLVIGGGRPEYSAGLLQLARDLNIDDAVVFTGYRHDARELLTGCQALLMTAPDEPWGRVVAEAMLDGVPVAAMAGGGVTELVDHEVNGLLSPPGDHRALAANLIRLHRDQALVSKLARSARDRAARAWTAERYVETIENTIAIAARGE